MKSHGPFDYCLAWILAVFIAFAIVYPFYYESQRIPPEPFDQQLESIDGMTYEGPRSSEWVSVRNEFVRLHPRCEACGSGYDLNVHHVEPFHLRPDLELEPSNLITLCREHHFRIGHDPDGPWKPQKPSWSYWNPKVREHAAIMRKAKR